MLTVPEEILGPRGPGKEKRQDVLIRLLHVAGGAGKNEVVAPVVRTLSFPRRDVIERNALFRNATATVCAHGAVPVEKPSTCVGVGVPARRQRAALMRRRMLCALTRPTVWTHSIQRSCTKSSVELVRVPG